MSGLEDAPSHEFEPNFWFPDRCDVEWGDMMCGYSLEDHLRVEREREMDEKEHDEGYTCDCEHKPARGWKGKMPVALDGNSWPLDFAAKMLGCSEKDLRDLVRITGLEPTGTMKMASYRRSGRNPRAYDGSKLVLMWQAVNDLAENLHEDN